MSLRFKIPTKLVAQAMVILSLCAGTLQTYGRQEETPNYKEMFKFQSAALGDIPEYGGLTAEGLEHLKSIRDALRQRSHLFNQNFLNLESMHHMVTVARAFKGNAFIYGPPGGAKSAVVKWIFSGEKNPAFQLQLHQMRTEQDFIGAQNLEEIKKGRVVYNTEGSLVDHECALIDEIEKGNPSALAALLSLLNEREVLLGKEVIKAKTETVFATSNSNLHEFFQQFLESGHRSTAPALLNRFDLYFL